MSAHVWMLIGIWLVIMVGFSLLNMLAAKSVIARCLVYVCVVVGGLILIFVSTVKG